MFGSHLSIAGSMLNALTEARGLGLDCVQVFTKNQQQWKAKPLDPAIVRDWNAEVARLGWNAGGPDGRGGIVSHASYLINLASADDALWRKSVDLMRDEVERCEALGIPYLVHHPGSFKDHTLEGGLARIEDAYAELFASTRGYRTVSCFEGTVGAGSLIGGRFEHLRDLRARVAARTGAPERLGFCLDTCHVHSAGYDLSTLDLARAALAEFDALCGLSHVKVWHLNDSKAPAGSKRDLHQHVGAGTIGRTPRRLAESGFAAVLALPGVGRVPKIMETPKGERAPGKPWDAENLRRLKRLLPTAGNDDGAVGAADATIGTAGAASGARVEPPRQRPVRVVTRKVTTALQPGR